MEISKVIYLSWKQNNLFEHSFELSITSNNLRRKSVIITDNFGNFALIQKKIT